MGVKPNNASVYPACSGYYPGHSVVRATGAKRSGDREDHDVIGLVPLQGSPVPTVSLLTITTRTVSSLFNPAVRAGLALCQSPLNLRSWHHTVQQALRTRSNAGFFHPLRFRITAIGLAGLEYRARHVVADQLGQVGGALQQ